MTLTEAIKIRQRQLNDFTSHHPRAAEAIEVIKVEVPLAIAKEEARRPAVTQSNKGATE